MVFDRRARQAFIGIVIFAIAFSIGKIIFWGINNNSNYIEGVVFLFSSLLFFGAGLGLKSVYLKIGFFTFGGAIIFSGMENITKINPLIFIIIKIILLIIALIMFLRAGDTHHIR